MTPSPAASAQGDLDSAWTSLHAQLQLAGDFWLGFVFVASAGAAANLRERLAETLRLRGAKLQLVRPAEPLALASSSTAVLDARAQPQDIVWLECVAVDPAGSAPGARGPWLDAWRQFGLRLNERRDLLMRNHAGALVIVAPLAGHRLLRESAPDLWSMRDLVLEVGPVEAASRLEEPRQADRSVVTAEGIGPAWNHLAAAEEALAREDTALAAEHVRLGLQQSVDPLDRGRWALGVLGAKVFRFWRAEEAHGCAAIAESVAQGRLTWFGENAETLRDLSVGLDNVGKACRDDGDSAAARAAFEESLSICRRILQAWGENPQGLRDLSVSLDNVGEACRDDGDHAAARSAFEESLSICRRILQAWGERPQAKADLDRALARLDSLNNPVPAEDAQTSPSS